MKTRNYKLLIAMILFAISPFGVVKGQTSVEVGVGKTYTNVKAAFDAINNGTLTGAIALKITSSITNSSSAILNATGGSANYSSVSIYPTVNDVLLSGTLNGSLFVLNGADYVTINGSVNDGTSMSNSMTIRNTNSGTSANVIELKSGASSNTIKYCNITTNITNYGGNIIKFNANDANNNSGNLITKCKINSYSSGKSLIYATGSSTGFNTSNTLSFNEFYSFIKAGVESKAININDHSSNWTIQDNSFYEPSTISGNSYSYYCIYINTGDNFRIERNFFGGQAVSCSSSNPLEITGTNSPIFYGIYMNVGNSTASLIDGNIIRKINISSSNATPFYGIYINAGAVKLGTSSSNYIGKETSNDSIIVTNTSNNAISYGIYNKSDDNTEIYETRIGSIKTVGSSSFSHSFYGIYKTGSGTTKISNNYIGSTSTSNSINISSASTSTTAQELFGIFSAGSGSVTISANTISKISNNYAYSSATDGKTIGVYTTSGSNTISNNRIYDISTTSPSNGKTVSSASLIGISQSSTSAGQSIYANTIYNLTNNISASRDVAVYGICYAGATSGTNDVYGNFIYNLNVNYDATTPEIAGVKIETGTTSYYNNIIFLGSDVTYGPNIYGIYEPGTSGNTCNLFHNSIYIAGTSPTTSSNSYCLYNNANNNTRDFRNNILFNARTATSGSSHYALSLSGITNLTINYNDYYVTGTGGTLASISSSDITSLNDIKTATTQDVNSVNIDPVFNTAGGTNSFNYYPLSTSLLGITISGVSTDFDLGSRDDPPTIGALEGINKWVGITDDDFATATNWTLKSVPTAGQDIRFHTNAQNHCLLDQDRTIGSYINSVKSYFLKTNGHKLILQGNIQVTNDSKLDASYENSTLVFKGTATQNIPSNTLLNNQVYNFEIDNSNNVTLFGALKIKGVYTKTNGLLNTITNSATIEFNGISGLQIIPDDIFSNDNTVYSLTVNNGDNVILNGALKVAGVLAANSGSLNATTNSTTIEFVGEEGPQEIPGSFFIDNKAYRIKISNVDGVSLGGDVSVENELFFNTGGLFLSGNTLTLNGTIDNTYSNGLFGSDASNLIIGGTADKSIQFNQVDIANYSILDITIDCSGNVAFGSHNLINIVGSLTQTSGSISATDNNRIIFSGTDAQQTITNNFFLNNKVSSLEMNNPNGVLLDGNFQVQSELVFTQGNLDAVTNTLTLEAGSAVSCDGTTGYVIGNCAKIGNTAFTFPVGGATYFGPVTITAPSNTDDVFTVSCIESDPAVEFSTNKQFNIDELCTQRYWNIYRNHGSSNVKISLPWCTNMNNPFTTENIDRASVMHWSGTEWEYIPSSMTGDIDAGSTTTSDAVSSFSPFTFGTRKTSLLPVEFVKMEMNCENNTPVLNWQTASETNNDYFEIQSSNDTKAWSKVATIKGAGNSNQLINYSFSDIVNGLYYRIKQVDFNQKIAYSQPITSYCNPQLSNDNVAIYPNPTTGNISINITNNRINCRYSILDGIGKTVMSGNLSELSNAIDLTNLSNGIYFIKIDGFEKIEKISKQ